VPWSGQPIAAPGRGRLLLSALLGILDAHTPLFPKIYPLQLHEDEKDEIHETASLLIRTFRIRNAPNFTAARAASMTAGKSVLGQHAEGTIKRRRSEVAPKEIRDLGPCHRRQRHWREARLSGQMLHFLGRDSGGTRPARR
jgi:hypothetical protein